MPFHRSSLLALVGILLTGGATGVIIWVSRRPEASRVWPVKEAGRSSVTLNETHRPPKPGHSGWVDMSEDIEDVARADGSVAPGSLPRRSPAAAAEDWSHYQPTPEELAYRAFKVEQEANKELANLLQVLDLDNAQQDRVFAALARRSAFFHPSLQPLGEDGAPVKTLPTQPQAAAPDATPAVPVPTVDEAAPPSALPADPVLAELTPEQVDVYERYTSERDAFWVGVVEDVEQEINAQ